MYLKIIILFALTLSLCSCSDPKPKPKEKINTCRAICNPLATKGNNYYFLVSNFNHLNKDCYQVVSTYIAQVKDQIKPPFTLHFMDDLPSFKPPTDDQMYGGDAIRRRVIAQYIYGQNEVLFDPFGYGIYIESGN